MALFSRRPKKPAEPAPEAQAADVGAVDPAAAGTAPAGTEQPDPSAPAPAGAPRRAADADLSPGSAEREPGGDALTAGRAPEAAGTSEAAPVDAAPVDAASGLPETDAAASVSISVSSFGGLGVSPRASKPARAGAQGENGTVAPPQARPRLGTREWMRTAPDQTETVPGLRDNALLHAALGRVGDAPPSQALLDVARQLMQGHVFLRVKGDARTLLAEGKGLPLAVATVKERTFALVYSSGAALQASLKADGDAETSAMGQPVLTVLRHVFASSYDGIIIDPASAPSRAVLPTELLRRAVDQADPQLTIKTLLTAERTDATAAEVAQALTHAPLWVAVGTAEGGAKGLAEGRAADGARYLEIYSHPLEVAVMGRRDSAAPITGAQLARALRTDEGLTGVVVDPAGPWVRLTRDALAPVLALAD